MTYAIQHEGQATDPGSEVVDLAAELALTDTEARSYLDVHPEEITPDLAKLTGFASDYEWATWLAAVLRDAGLMVVLYPSWQLRGRPRPISHDAAERARGRRPPYLGGN